VGENLSHFLFADVAHALATFAGVAVVDVAFVDGVHGFNLLHFRGCLPRGYMIPYAGKEVNSFDLKLQLVLDVEHLTLENGSRRFPHAPHVVTEDDPCRAPGGGLGGVAVEKGLFGIQVVDFVHFGFPPFFSSGVVLHRD